MKLLPSASHIPTRSLFVARNAAYVTVSGGARIDLSTKGTLRRIIRALVQAHRESPRRGLTVHEVFAAAWADELANPDTLAGRVYSAFSKLRRLGLGDIIGRTEAGYLLDPRCCVIEERAILVVREPATVIHSPVVPARLAS